MKDAPKPKDTASQADDKRLFIDLEVCSSCPECVTSCDYFYHPGNNGAISVRERAALSIVCRRCENPLCVSACTRDALEKSDSGALRRHNMLCVGCKSCSLACPFGTLLPEIIPYAVSVCDYCLGSLPDDNVPLCLETCPLGAIRFVAVREDVSNNRYAVDEHLVVHALPWKKEAAAE